jgi:hypothetical protein
MREGMLTVAEGSGEMGRDRPEETSARNDRVD